MAKKTDYWVLGIKNLAEDTPEEYYDNGRRLCEDYKFSENTFYRKSSGNKFFIMGKIFLIRWIEIKK